MTQHLLTLLPKGDYYARCVEVNMKDDCLELTWKVDVGEHKWRTVKDSFYEGEVAFLDMCNGLKYTPLDDFNDSLFPLQFLYKRSKLTVDRAIDGQFKVNRIIEYALPDIPEEVAVHEEKDEEHFFHSYGRSLPINN